MACTWHVTNSKSRTLIMMSQLTEPGMVSESCRTSVQETEGAALVEIRSWSQAELHGKNKRKES